MSSWIFRLPRSVTSLILIISVLIPMLFPLGIPFSIGESTREFKSRIDNVQPSDNILFIYEAGAGVWPEIRAGVVAILCHIIEKDANIIFVTLEEDSPLLLEKTFDIVKPSEKGFEYGKDYVNLGYFVGRFDIPMKQLADDLHVGIEDWYGTPLKDLEIMNDIKTAVDIDIAIMCSNDYYGVLAFIRQWVSPYGVEFWSISGSSLGTNIVPMIPEQVNGQILSSRGGAEYEMLMGKPGYGTSIMDAISLSHIAVMLLFAIALYQVFTGKNVRKVI